MNMFTKNVKPRKRGRPPGQTPQGAAARDRLYATAMQLIAARGYEATTLRDIAKEAGVSVGLLYRYFPSKQAVVIALYDELSSEYARQAAAMPPGRWRDRFIFALNDQPRCAQAASRGSPGAHSGLGWRSRRRHFFREHGVLSSPRTASLRGGGCRIERCTETAFGCSPRPASVPRPSGRAFVVAAGQELRASARRRRSCRLRSNFCLLRL